MADYWGLEPIAARMSVHVSTLLRWHETKGFMMYLRRKGLRRYWYSNDQLILTWEMARVQQDREAKASTKHLRKRLQKA